jgi:hypothetical protein
MFYHVVILKKGWLDNLWWKRSRRKKNYERTLLHGETVTVMWNYCTGIPLECSRITMIKLKSDWLKPWQISKPVLNKYVALFVYVRSNVFLLQGTVSSWRWHQSGSEREAGVWRFVLFWKPFTIPPSIPSRCVRRERTKTWRRQGI